MKGMLSGRTLSKISLALLCACLVQAAGASAQEKQAGPPSARKVDEFGRLRGCDAGARADGFVLELLNHPDAKGYIVARDSRERLWGVAHAYGEHLIDYLVNTRGLEESRFVLLDGASVAGEGFLIEFWLVPEGAKPPRAKPPGTKDAPAFKGKYADQTVYDDLTFNGVDGGVDAAAFSSDLVFASYAKLLRKQPESRGYIVVYSPPGAAPGYWHRAGTREQQKLTAGGDPASDRVTVIHGGALPAKEKAADGYDREESFGRMELWVGAKDGAPPVKHVEEDARFTEAVKVSNDSFYGDESERETTAWVLGNLAEMLRAHEGSVACLVIYAGDGSGTSPGEDGVERPAPDVFKLAEKWKAELLKKHGLAPHRVVFLHGSQETDYGRIEAWAVPRGAALPDPFVEDEEEMAVEEEAPAAEGDGGGKPAPPAPPAEERGVSKRKWL